MLFPTTAFAIFFVVAFLVNWLARPHHSLWRVLMISMSFFFYGYWNWKFTFLLAGSIVGNWAAAHAVFAYRVDNRLTPTGRVALAGAVALNLTVLGIFKYYGFFATSLVDILRRVGIEASPPLLEVILPVGISFFTFQAVSYVIDVGRGVFTRPMSLPDFALFLSFFPQLVAGPIVRASEMADQITRRPDPRRIPAAEAFGLILAGLFKKVVISSYLASTIVDPVFAVPSQHSSLEVLFAVYAYAIQIFADFSGYTDIAIGCALLLGFRFPQNFNSPYRALTIQDFWRRWHMTLSTWLRDYLYIPLGGNRRGIRITYRNLWLTMVLGGLWHGAAWNFVVWGMIHGTALAAERFIGERWQPLGAPDWLVKVGRWFITFHIVCLAWIFFRAPTFDRATQMLDTLFSGGAAAGMITTLLVVVVVGMIAAQFIPRDWGTAVAATATRMPLAVQAVALALALTVIDGFGPEGIAPFIYFQF